MMAVFSVGTCTFSLFDTLAAWTQQALYSIIFLYGYFWLNLHSLF